MAHFTDQTIVDEPGTGKGFARVATAYAAAPEENDRGHVLDENNGSGQPGF